MECFLYCSYPQNGQNGCSKDGNGHEQCAPQNSRAGADAINIIDFHFYDQTGNPETDLNTSQNIRNTGVLESQEVSKPLWVGEGSWGDTVQNTAIWLDPYAEGGFVPRYFATMWAQTLPTGSSPCNWSSPEVCQQSLWYGYDYDDTQPPTGFVAAVTGAIYCAGNLLNGGQCNGGTPKLFQTQATMWNTAVGWLTGAIPNSTGSNVFCNQVSPNSTTWYCDFQKSGTNHRMVWDNSNAQNAKTSGYCAATFTNPYVCGTTPYSPPPQYQYYEDLHGTVRNVYTVPFVVGLNPILLCSNSSCLP